MIDNCVFRNNMAVSPTKTARGAINLMNTASGGAIFAPPDQCRMFNVSNSLFVGNGAALNGGAICASTVTIVNCTFVENLAVNGAALMNFPSEIYIADAIIVNCTFENNFADTASLYFSTANIRY